MYEWLEEKSASVNANEIYVVSGAVYAGRQNSGDLRCDLDTGLNFDRTSSSTTNFMAVPSHFFKILCDTQNQESIAYLDENVQDGNLFGMSVRNLEEKFLKYDLFPRVLATHTTIPFHTGIMAIGKTARRVLTCNISSLTRSLMVPLLGGQVPNGLCLQLQVVLVFSCSSF